MLEGIKLQRRDERGITFLSVDGFLDSSNVRPFEQQLIQLQKEGCARIVLNIEGLEYICSAGLAALVLFRDSLRKNRGEMMLVNTPEKIAHLFDTLGFADFFKILDSESEALREFHTVRG